MYNKANVQPQNPSTGQNQPSGAAQASSSEQGAAPQSAPVMPNALPAHMDPSSVETWIVEVNNAVASTPQNPRQRADTLFDIRSRYQRDILGYKPQAREG